MANLQAQTDDLQKTLDDFGKYQYLCAPEDGKILTLSANSGQAVSQNQLFASFGLGTAMEITCDISLDNNFVILGDTCKISNTAHTLDASVTKIDLTDTSKKLTLLVDNPDVSSGETFDIRFQKQSAQPTLMVPNAAIGTDSTGSFVYVVKRRDGILGKEFYVQKMYVYTGDSDNSYTIVNGFGFFQPIVISSSKYIADGYTVKLKNESDFFAS